MFKTCVLGGVPQNENFQSESYGAIVTNTTWAERLGKPHPWRNMAKILRANAAMELESCCSSDALLMNIFCYPGALEALAPLLNCTGSAELTFGFKARVAFGRNRHDRTEVDLRIVGNQTVFCEAKLTEEDFTTKSTSHVHRYLHFAAVFEPAKLRTAGGVYLDYQLIRNIIAAHEHGASFYLLHDERRLDLRNAFDATVAAVLQPTLRARCNALTWQQVAAQVPQDLRGFLRDKYGIQ